MINTYADAVQVVHNSADRELYEAYQDCVKFHYDTGFVESQSMLAQYRDMFKSLQKDKVEADKALEHAEKEILLEIGRRWSLLVQRTASERSLFSRRVKK